MMKVYKMPVNNIEEYNKIRAMKLERLKQVMADTREFLRINTKA